MVPEGRPQKMHEALGQIIGKFGNFHAAFIYSQPNNAFPKMPKPITQVQAGAVLIHSAPARNAPAKMPSAFVSRGINKNTGVY